MFHESGTVLPKGVGTSTPEEVARAVVSAIERNRFEVDVAPVGMRMVSTFASLAPATAAKLTQKVGGGTVAAQLAEGQRHKR
jgi:uncharacterized protein